MWDVLLDNVEATQAVGTALGRVVTGPTLVALVGDLGAGKTCFAQGLGFGLDVSQPVVSPTFVLMAEYSGRLPLLHADVYRLSAAELPGIGLEEALECWEGAALVEWADRFPELMPEHHMQIEFQHVPQGRRMRVTAVGPAHAAVLARWRSEWAGSDG